MKKLITMSSVLTITSSITPLTIACKISKKNHNSRTNADKIKDAKAMLINFTDVEITEAKLDQLKDQIKLQIIALLDEKDGVTIKKDIKINKKGETSELKDIDITTNQIDIIVSGQFIVEELTEQFTLNTKVKLVSNQQKVDKVVEMLQTMVEEQVLLANTDLTLEKLTTAIKHLKKYKLAMAMKVTLKSNLTLEKNDLPFTTFEFENVITVKGTVESEDKAKNFSFTVKVKEKQDNNDALKQLLQDKILEVNISIFFKNHSTMDKNTVTSYILNNDKIKAVTTEKLTSDSFQLTNIKNETIRSFHSDEIYNVTLKLKNNDKITFKIKFICADLHKLEEEISKLNKISNQELLVDMKIQDMIEYADEKDVIDQIKKLPIFKNTIKSDKPDQSNTNLNEFTLIDNLLFLSKNNNDNLLRKDLIEVSIITVKGAIIYKNERSTFSFTVKLVNAHKSFLKDLRLDDPLTFDFNPLKKYSELDEQIIEKIDIFRNKPLTNYKIKYYEGVYKPTDKTNEFQTGRSGSVFVSIIADDNHPNWQGETTKKIQLKFKKNDLSTVNKLTDKSGNYLVITVSKGTFYNQLWSYVKEAREIKGINDYYVTINDKFDCNDSIRKSEFVWVKIYAKENSDNWYGKTNPIKIQIICEILIF